MIAGIVSLTLAQQAGTVGPWWLELSRYLPYPALLVPAVVALLISCRLGWRWVVASGIALALVLVFAMGFAWGRPDVKRDGDVPLRFMTYNIKAYKAALRPDGFAELAREVARQAPDILVAQDSYGPYRKDEAAGMWPDGRAFGMPYSFAAGQYVVASRYPVRACSSGSIDQRNQVHSYVRCVVDVNGVELNVVTVHFESPRNGLNAARREGFDGVEDWEQNYEDRLGQSRALARDLQANGARPLIVAGDLNAPEASSVVRTLLAGGLRDAFSSASRGYGFSYGHALRLGFSFLRIDHVLVSPEVGVANVFVGGAQASEHRPVIADLLLHPR
ncbi:MAG: endonuclease/exonuclease/phosphatase family protein [Burkholderiaceae bacterium]